MKTHLPSLLQRTVAASFAAALSASALLAAETPAAAVAPAGDLPKTVAYHIASSDVLSVSIIGEQELNAGNKRVDSAGNINLALVGEVHVGGLTVPEAQAAVETSYKDNRILRNPQVAINIELYSPREVSIGGMIKTPGKYPLLPEAVLTLKDLVLRAGGFTDTANGRKVRVSRTLPDGSVKIFVKDIDSVIKSRGSATSVDGSFVLEPGDVIYVDEKII